MTWRHGETGKRGGIERIDEIEGIDSIEKIVKIVKIEGLTISKSQIQNPGSTIPSCTP